MIRRIKRFLALRKFNKECPHVRCTFCNKSYADENGNRSCNLKRRLGLDD